MMYQISTRNHEQLFQARAESIEEAAQRAARRLHGRAATALRVTGTRGLSGMFQAYKSARTGGQTSIGDNFHVGS